MGRRQPPVNWEQQMQNFLDSYDRIYSLPGVRKETALAHAVQKDGIQNSTDAEDAKNPDEWSVTFELNLRTSPYYVAITDTGTCGLTGRSNLDAQDLSSLSPEVYRIERWSRFESLGYKNPDPWARGARGQGKFIFIGSSETGEMIYETLRADGVYRIGHWTTSEADPLMDPLKNDEARDYLKEKIPDLEPLGCVGTRVIILKPKKEFIESFIPLLNCDLYKYISETWWKLLTEGRKIYIKKEDKRISVEPPQLYRKFMENRESFKYDIIKDADISRYVKGAKVEELVIAYSEEEIPELLEGIAVLRGGMKVEFFDVTHGNEHISPKYRRHIFGWVILNKKAESLLKATESSTHYSFKQSRGSLALELMGRSGWLSNQVSQFAQIQLGITPESKRRIQIERAQILALSALNRFARSIGYAVSTQVGTGRGVEGERGPTLKEIRVQMPEPNYPYPGLKRVEFDQEVSEIKACAVNDSKHPQKLRFDFSLKRKHGRATAGEEVVHVFEEAEFTLQPKEKSKEFGPHTVRFASKAFEAGTYAIEARIFSLPESEELDASRHLVYLNINPPAAGLFKDIQYVEFKPPTDKLQYRIERDGEKLILKVNTIHHLYKLASEMQISLEKAGRSDLRPLDYNYVLGLGLVALVKEDLVGPGKLLEKSSPLVEVRDEYFEIFEKTLHYESTLRQELLHKAFKGFYPKR
jgi:hypothetical protein